ncbi:hypothetical protein F444_00288 [Phytophthora nicotianae P1976]|uniref:Uncharacterized protein n=1 Tax=Phytophthora nicotianae P1976 TaxID=1317066 RepID=A0A081B4S2_PHYNI|nr:hypothetical protein F444_00288 [Phytophthora nicotianae P1976]
MRQQNSDGVMMVPYVNTISSASTDVEAEKQQKIQKPVAKRAKKAPVKSVGKSFQRNREHAATSEGKKSPVLSLKDAFSSPIGRISRAEALSPPPSPSSVTSSDAGENIDSPKTVKTRRPLFSSKRQQKFSKPVNISPPKEEQEVEAKSDPSRTPPKTFLKRKPYKVVFHKLDWSSVASKTDSNLPTSNKNPKNPSVASKTSRSSSRASNSVATSNTGDTITDTDSVLDPKPGVVIDAATAERLTALETAMYEQCGVTRETAPLARFKYQNERKKFVATLQSQAQARQDDNSQPAQPPSQASSELDIGNATLEAAMTELWKKLTGDSSGQIYASMLRNLIEAKSPIEPTEPDSVGC